MYLLLFFLPSLIWSLPPRETITTQLTEVHYSEKTLSEERLENVKYHLENRVFFLCTLETALVKGKTEQITLNKMISEIYPQPKQVENFNQHLNTEFLNQMSKLKLPKNNCPQQAELKMVFDNKPYLFKVNPCNRESPLHELFGWIAQECRP